VRDDAKLPVERLTKYGGLRSLRCQSAARKTWPSEKFGVWPDTDSKSVYGISADFDPDTNVKL
jgi:hypothetical protein